MFEDSGVVGGLAMIAIALLMNWEIRKSALLLRELKDSDSSMCIPVKSLNSKKIFKQKTE